MTRDEATTALAAMLPHNRADVEAIRTAPNVHIAYVRMCHERTWPGDWAEYVWDVLHPKDPPSTPGGASDWDDDIPF